MSAEKLAKRYAKALFDEVIAKDQIELVNKDMVLVAQTIEASKELKLFLRNPIINSAKKQNALNQIFADKISADSKNLITLLINNNRVGYLGVIALYFQKLYNEHHGIMEVTITTAIPMDDATEEEVKKVILSKVGDKKLIINSIIDEKIMGGFIIDLGNKVYDASVRNKLSNIANELIYN